MPICYIHGINYTTEDILEKMREEIITAIISIPELGLNEDMVSVFFPADQRYIMNEGVSITIMGLYDKPERTEEVRNILARNVGKTIETWLPGIQIECLIFPFIPAQGFWCSQDELRCTHCRHEIAWTMSTTVILPTECNGEIEVIGYPCQTCGTLHEKDGKPIMKDGKPVTLKDVI
ncbi:MAG: hypothetical protein WCX74_02025 [Candidatus Paceibacterota bacterium]